VIRGQLIPFDNKGEEFYNSSNLVYESERTGGNLRVKSDQFEFEPQGAKSAKITFWTEKVNGLTSKFSKVSTHFSYKTE
jgi:hypothetical protein